MTKKTFVLTVGTGGGAWGYAQILNAEHCEVTSGISIRELTDFYHAGSVGNIICSLSATGEKDTSGSQSRFTAIKDRFATCARKMLDGKIRQEQLSRAVMHDLYHLRCGNARMEKLAEKKSGKGIISLGRQIINASSRGIQSLVLRDSTGEIHLDHDILHNYLITELGSIKLRDLKTPYFSFAKKMDNNEHVCFANFNGLDPIFDADKWAVVPNMSSDKTLLSDAIMASTAASTVFPAYEIDGISYVDCASFISPLQTIKNIFRMAGEAKNDIRIEVLFFGTGNMADFAWSSGKYNNHGPLQMMSDLVRAMGLGVIQEDIRELEADFADRVRINYIDTSIPERVNGKDFAYDPFDFSEHNQVAIERAVQADLKKHGDDFASIFTRIAEQKAKEAIDPLIVRPTFFDRFKKPRKPTALVA